MTSDRAIRASDEDRERTAAALSGHYAAGRLTFEEFQQRLDQAFAARTLHELADLMTDLPATDLSQLTGEPGGHPPLPAPRVGGTVQAHDASPTVFWRFWLAVTIGVFVFWLVSGPTGPWFWLAAIALAFVVLRRWAKGMERRIREHHQTRQ
jgi:hypothetical protein